MFSPNKTCQVSRIECQQASCTPVILTFPHRSHHNRRTGLELQSPQLIRHENGILTLGKRFLVGREFCIRSKSLRTNGNVHLLEKTAIRASISTEVICQPVENKAYRDIMHDRSRLAEKPKKEKHSLSGAVASMGNAIHLSGNSSTGDFSKFIVRITISHTFCAPHSYVSTENSRFNSNQGSRDKGSSNAAE